MTKLTNPQPQFLDLTGALMDGGYIYVGEANADPEASPVATYWDSGLTIPTGQLRTLGGFIVNGAAPSNVFLAESDYSMRTRDQDGVQIFYSPSVYTDADQFQPADIDLTAIAALSTTPYGRSLLTLANQAALVAAVGNPEAMPITGGTFTAAIYRLGAGAYCFGAEGGLTGMRIFNPLPLGTPDPSGVAGDIVGYY